ncbi:uncharacterized protein BYT42DRAFT_612169 [Radiomyces spectabilis]|uniref:uncharacterized protein n=1 Tax=Radiomyces spectabilis TaxID=64574 RepID=UPI002220379F|nr:uncharacterized protein BYT42DRAFT_612169 [Radiomyces spectabilis]KAI8384471.1 hypothetical protein BYT42DRAFT_612169 [Radiomyces spectabilis]
MEHINEADVYDRLGENTAKCGTVAEFRDHLRTLASVYNRLYNFNRSYRHREKRALLERKRQNDHAQNGQQLVRRPSRKEFAKTTVGLQAVQRCRKQQRRQRARRGRKRPQDAAVVAFGDADLSSLNGNPPVPVKKFRQVLAQKALVLCIDEYRTSKVCSSCDTTTIEVRDNNQMFCRHKKKKKRVREIDKRLRQRCLDENNDISSDCGARRPGYLSIVYPVRMYPHCVSKNDVSKPLAWNRDINAGVNMRRILQAYIESGYPSGSSFDGPTAHNLRSASKVLQLASC